MDIIPAAGRLEEENSWSAIAARSSKPSNAQNREQGQMQQATCVETMEKSSDSQNIKNKKIQARVVSRPLEETTSTVKIVIQDDNGDVFITQPTRLNGVSVITGIKLPSVGVKETVTSILKEQGVYLDEGKSTVSICRLALDAEMIVVVNIQIEEKAAVWGAPLNFIWVSMENLPGLQLGR